MPLEQDRKRHGQIRLLSCLNVLAPCDTNKDLKKLEADKRIIIVVILRFLLEVSRLKVRVDDSCVESFVCHTSFLKELPELVSLEIRRLTTRNGRADKYVFDLSEVAFYQICDARIHSVLPNEPFRLPVLEVMLETRCKDLRCVLLPIPEDRELLDESVRMFIYCEHFSEDGDALLSHAHDQTAIVVLEGAIFFCLVVEQVLLHSVGFVPPR